jgi:novobiocin biosynthesis protein NovU/D-mycarose 3-C-methyltransferase
MKINNCPISGESGGIEYLNLGEVPIVNNLCETREESFLCERFPLAVQLFPKSKLNCLIETINRENIYSNYLYRSGVNKPYLDHCVKMYDYLSYYIDFQAMDLLIDIGGNDGTLLNIFRRENRTLYYINVDCSKNFIEENNNIGLQYINEYFDENTHLPSKVRLITSTNVFQHTEQIRSFVRGIYRNLSNDGIWCLEFPYILTTIANDNYDQIYHEHIYYYCLKNIIDITSQEGMKVINVSYHDIHAGTLRILCAKNTSRRQVDSTIDSFLNLEKTLTEEYCIKWGIRTHEKIKKYKIFISELINKGKTIAGFGAAAKGCVFLNTCGIDYQTLQFIIDDTPFKQNKYVPGTGIQIVSRDILKYNSIDYILILAHNFRDYIIESLKDQFKGKYIVMFPDIRIL